MGSEYLPGTVVTLDEARQMIGRPPLPSWMTPVPWWRRLLSWMR